MANPNFIGCYFHPDFKRAGSCSVCGRNFCNACLKGGGGYCWACSPLVNVKDKDNVAIFRIMIEPINIALRRALNLRTTKITLDGSFLDINLKPTRPFHGEVLSLNCLIMPSPSTINNPTPIFVCFENKELGRIRSIWDPHNRLIYTSVDIRRFTGILKRISLWVLSAIFSHILVIAYTMITKNIGFWEFLNQWSRINYWLFFLLFIFIGLILTKFFVIPCRWSPGKVEVTGKIKDYFLDKWEITNIKSGIIIKRGWRIFLTLTTEDGGERYVLLEGSKENIQIIGEDRLWNIKDYLEKAKNENIILKFGGRELFNVLVCNIEDKYCSIERTISPSPVEITPTTP